MSKSMKPGYFYSYMFMGKILTTNKGGEGQSNSNIGFGEAKIMLTLLMDSP